MRWATPFLIAAVAGVTTHLALMAARAGPELAWSVAGDGLRVVGDVVDVGAVRPRAPRPLRVGLRNEGADPVVLERVRTTCGCLRIDRATVWGQTIAPGGVFHFDVDVDVRGYARGPFRQRLRASLAGVAEPRTLFVQGSVATAIAMPRETLDFGRVRAGTGATADLVFQCDDATPWQVTRVGWREGGPGLPPLAYMMLPGDGGRRVARVTCPPPACPDGRYEDDILVETSHPDLPRFVAKARLEVVGGVSVVPPRAALGRCRAGAAGRWFELTVDTSETVTIVGLRVEGARDPESLLEVALAPRNKLRIRYSGARAPRTRLEGVVELRAGAATFAVPVRGIVLAPAGG